MPFSYSLFDKSIEKLSTFCQEACLKLTFESGPNMLSDLISFFFKNAINFDQLWTIFQSFLCLTFLKKAHVFRRRMWQYHGPFHISSTCGETLWSEKREGGNFLASATQWSNRWQFCLEKSYPKWTLFKDTKCLDFDWNLKDYDLDQCAQEMRKSSSGGGRWISNPTLYVSDEVVYGLLAATSAVTWDGLHFQLWRRTLWKQDLEKWHTYSKDTLCQSHKIMALEFN